VVAVICGVAVMTDDVKITIAAFVAIVAIFAMAIGGTHL
jgi:hypothetical protein